MGKGKVYTCSWLGNRKEGDHLDDSVIYGRIILKWISEKWLGRAWTGSMWLRIGARGRLS
jgi:hypothetical protein